MKVHRRDIVRRGIFKTEPALFSWDHFSDRKLHNQYSKPPCLLWTASPHPTGARQESSQGWISFYYSWSWRISSLHPASSANTQHKYQPSNVSQVKNRTLTWSSYRSRYTWSLSTVDIMKWDGVEMFNSLTWAHANALPMHCPLL